RPPCARHHLRFASIGSVFQRTLPCGRNALYGDSFHPLLPSANTVRFALRIAANSSARLPKWVKRGNARFEPKMSAFCPMATGKRAARWPLGDVEGRCPAVIQASELRARIMRYELADHEWAAIKPMLPNKPRGVPRVNDRRVLNGIFWVLRSGAPWRDLPNAFGPYTTCYNCSLASSGRLESAHECTGCRS